MSSMDGMLVRLALQGDQGAFARLTERHRPGPLNLALSQVGNVSEAEDFVQEAFIQAYQHLATLQDAEKFPGWIYRITRNLCYAAPRNQRLAFQSLDAPDAVEACSESMTPDALIEGRELSEPSSRLWRRSLIKTKVYSCSIWKAGRTETLRRLMIFRHRPFWEGHSGQNSMSKGRSRKMPRVQPAPARCRLGEDTSKRRFTKCQKES